ncbi:hypothetical protein TSOC_003234 [Tetrabaena socialis]|uniref:Uncharacterized protein n=1 Tax=Tetrabaena socialis TaxID=47790 RepID=A0A2J8AC36_9CHLO|nr:hypothetical protein TSOC_003234 [Tetrabaena socialis]|eukprot:PNH10053.1 hypothetical protein TSOC_003234 [Tetrabaena socialis]
MCFHVHDRTRDSTGTAARPVAAPLAAAAVGVGASAAAAVGVGASAAAGPLPRPSIFPRASIGTAGLEAREVAAEGRGASADVRGRPSACANASTGTTGRPDAAPLAAAALGVGASAVAEWPRPSACVSASFGTAGRPCAAPLAPVPPSLATVPGRDSGGLWRASAVGAGGAALVVPRGRLPSGTGHPWGRGGAGAGLRGRR